MKVYKIEHDDAYQYVLPADEGDCDILQCDGSTKSEAWRPPPLELQGPRLRKGNFFHFDSDALICDDRALQLLGGFFRASGEILELPLGDTLFHLINITKCIDCLDRGSSDYDVVGPDTGNGDFILIKTYAFFAERFLDSGLFKIPEEGAMSVMLVEGLREPAEEFKAIVDSSGLTGLEFELIWSDS